MDIEFVECEKCASTSGSQILCKSCLANRRAIDQLTSELEIERHRQRRLHVAVHESFLFLEGFAEGRASEQGILIEACDPLKKVLERLRTKFERI